MIFPILPVLLLLFFYPTCIFWRNQHFLLMYLNRLVDKVITWMAFYFKGLIEIKCLYFFWWLQKCMDCKFIRIFKVYLGFDIKYRSSKIHVFLLFIKPVFPMFDKSQDCSSKCGCILRTVRGTWNFVRQQATPAQGRAGEAHMNTDVNLRRLPDKRLSSQNS